MSNSFIVAIGSSAGGLTPMTSYFDFTPHDRATYVILRHLPKDYQSHLQKILERHSKLTIIEAKNGTVIEKDCIYIAPPAMYMTIQDETLYLQTRQPEELHPNWSVDVFLESLAKAKGKFGIAIILSGAGTDGTKGVKHVKEAGGMVLAQNIASCEHNSMPRHAIETGNVDFELMVDEMPPVVLQHISGILKNSALTENLKKAGGN